MKLFGTRALVTGGGRGIGRSIGLALAEAGADIMINYRKNAEAAENTASEIEALELRCMTLQAEMIDDDSINRLVDRTVKELGGVTILASNAGMHRRTPFLEIFANDWDEVLAADLRGPFLLC